MALKEYKAEKILYTMGEVTEMFDVKPSLIRFWEGRFDILKPQKNKKGNRLFTPADVKNLELIYHLTKERGMTLSGVEKYLKNNKEEAERETEIVRRLQTIRSLLAEIREELKEDAEGETSIFIEGMPENGNDFEMESEPKTVAVRVEPVVETPLSKETPCPEDEPETFFEREIPNPLEFIEETLPGEIFDEEPAVDDFWSEEQAVEELREEEEYPNVEPEADEEIYESAEWDSEDDTPDKEVSVPFTVQPLFPLDENDEIEPEIPAGEPEPEMEKPAAVDTQQSLF